LLVTIHVYVLIYFKRIDYLLAHLNHQLKLIPLLVNINEPFILTIGFVSYLNMVYFLEIMSGSWSILRVF